MTSPFFLSFSHKAVGWMIMGEESGEMMHIDGNKLYYTGQKLWHVWEGVLFAGAGNCGGPSGVWLLSRRCLIEWPHPWWNGFLFVTDCTSKVFLLIEAICLVTCMYLANKNIYYCETCFVSDFHCVSKTGSCTKNKNKLTSTMHCHERPSTSRPCRCVVVWRCNVVWL